MTWHPLTTDHALIRYVERAWGWDVRRIERDLVAAGQSAAPIEVIRFLEAEYGINATRLKQRISRGARLTRQMSERQRDIFIPWRGVQLVVRDGCVVTVLELRMGPKRRKRRRGRGGRSNGLQYLRDAHAGERADVDA